MVAPPPNVTGVLHMGHALNFVLQDILVRYKRMKKHNALWLFGTDHAGIATQAVFERHLKNIGKSKNDYEREELVQEIFKLKDKHRGVIVNQIKNSGRLMITQEKGLLLMIAFARLLIRFSRIYILKG